MLSLLEHVRHVVQGYEWVVDGDHLRPLLKGGAEDEATDAAEAVDADLPEKNNRMLQYIDFFFL